MLDYTVQLKLSILYFFKKNTSILFSTKNGVIFEMHNWSTLSNQVSEKLPSLKYLYVITDSSSVKRSGYCFRNYEVLNTVTTLYSSSHAKPIGTSMLFWTFI